MSLSFVIPSFVSLSLSIVSNELNLFICLSIVVLFIYFFVPSSSSPSSHDQDDEDPATTAAQRTLFDSFLRVVKTDEAQASAHASARNDALNNNVQSSPSSSSSTSTSPLATHCANSAALLTIGAAACSSARVGIALYGLEPTPARTMARSTTTLAPALSWHATVTQVRCVAEPGAGVSYSHTYRTQSAHEWLATIAVGYADGFRRTSGNRVVIDGSLCDVVGRVTMDQIVARVPATLCARLRIGDSVELIGSKRSAADVAAAWNTIDYDVVCSIGKRVSRHFVMDE